MNLFKLASLIDNVVVTVATVDSLSIVINGKRYNYAGMPLSGNAYDAQINILKRMKNKRQAGEQLSALIRNLDRYRIQA